MKLVRHLVAVAPLLAALSGCMLTYSPPIRGAHGGAPVPPSRPWLEAALLGPAGGYQGTLRMPLGRKVEMLVGGQGSEVQMMGFLGARLHPLAERSREQATLERPVVDLELEAGFGFGAGGELYCDEYEGACEDDRDPMQRTAYGGFAGLGVAYWAEPWFALYGRTLLQGSKASGIPYTSWATMLTGLQFVVGPVGAHFGIGYGGYHNTADAEDSLVLELGLSVTLGPRVVTPKGPPGGRGAALR